MRGLMFGYLFTLLKDVVVMTKFTFKQMLLLIGTMLIASCADAEVAMIDQEQLENGESYILIDYRGTEHDVYSIWGHIYHGAPDHFPSGLLMGTNLNFEGQGEFIFYFSLPCNEARELLIGHMAAQNDLNSESLLPFVDEARVSCVDEARYHEMRFPDSQN